MPTVAISFDVDVSQLLALAARAAAAGGAGRAAAVHVVSDTTDKVVKSAKAGAPRLTGALADSITGKAGGLRGVVDATIRYAPYVEFGTYKDPVQPFMMDALEANEGGFGNQMEVEFGNAIEGAL